MTPSEYERLVQALVSELTAAATRMGTCQVTGGSKNLVLGASGFTHQIDVSVSSPSDLLLSECKYWGRPVDAEAVLVLAARVADVAARLTGVVVRGALVSTKAPTEGARILAAHFNIDLEAVRNPKEYALRVFDHVFIGLHEVAHATDTIHVEVIRGGG